MKKEVLSAIILGVIIGLVLTYGIYTAQSAYKRQTSPASISETGNQASPLPSSDSSQNLTIITPENESIQSKDTAIITGMATPKAYVTAVTDTNDVLVQSDSEGNFSLELPLASGVNLITIESTTEAGTQEQKQVTVTYLPTTAASDSSSSAKAK
jgi:hypothetical protein